MSRELDQTRASLLARLAKDVDKDAWLEFWERYAELIHSFARQRQLQASDCDDVVQTVLMALLRAMPNFSYDPARGRFRGYLKTITLRAIYRKTRQNSDTSALEDVEHLPEETAALSEDPEVDALWESQWRQHHVRRAMRVIEQEFNEKDRAAFNQYVVAGLDPSATAEALGLSVDQVYQAKSRILKRLSTVIKQQQIEEG